MIQENVIFDNRIILSKLIIEAPYVHSLLEKPTGLMLDLFSFFAFESAPEIKLESWTIGYFLVIIACVLTNFSSVAIHEWGHAVLHSSLCRKFILLIGGGIGALSWVGVLGSSVILLDLFQAPIHATVIACGYQTVSVAGFWYAITS